MSDQPDDTVPLLPTLRDPRFNQMLRAALELLRDRTDDEAVRRRLDATLAGDLSLRDLAKDPAFGSFMAPLVARGSDEWDRMDDEVKQSYRADAEREIDI